MDHVCIASRAIKLTGTVLGFRADTMQMNRHDTILPAALGFLSFLSFLSLVNSHHASETRQE